MKLKDLTFVLNKLNELGYGEVELYTHWQDFKDKYPQQPEFHLHLNGINFNEFEPIFPNNPFTANVNINTFNISKEMSFVEKDVDISGCFDVWNKCKEVRKYMNLEE